MVGYADASRLGGWQQVEQRVRRRAVVGMPHPVEAAGLAERLWAFGVMPILAFTVPQVLACAEASAADAVIAHPHLPGGTCAEMLVGVRERSPAVVVGIGSANGDPWGAGAAVRLPRDATADEISEHLVAALADGVVSDAGTSLAFGNVRVDPARRLAWIGRQPMALTPLQFRILAALVAAGGAVLSAAELSQRVWGCALLGDRERVAVQVRRLRAKLSCDADLPQVLLTVRGEGYRLADPADVLVGAAR